MAVSRVDKVFLTKHLATLVKSGVPLSESLETVREQASPGLAKVLKEIEVEVNNGTSLADAMRKHKDVFDNFYISLVAAGEASGNLENNLSFLSDQMAKDYATRRKVMGALLYPGLVISATLVLGLLISWYVLPQLVDMFNSFEITLPLSTQILMGFAFILKNYGVFVVGGVFGLIFLTIALMRVKPVRFWRDTWILKVPLIGAVIKDGELGRFSRNMGTLLKSGIPVLRAFEISIETLGNLKFRNDLLLVKDKVASGKQIFEVMSEKRFKVFPKLLVRMVEVGEKSGNLEEMLDYLSQFYEDEIDSTSKNMGTLLEPALLIFIGGVVAFVAMSIISPIYGLIGQIK